ncbi:ATP-binding cassette domain-containing protein [Sinomonas sp. ASV322]|uniref:ATP-binding cassette domain-containing protein n=1 Tax=Sinomonas sp. ASV322 TaxID=3041920 RepID=UPI0027DB2E1F|nr:ATP-binding cassette domain-containing protein [Sinomonas sp. ASV322]MDQ4502648.1 ATP-binding cassette domain-containing protein [Sinomonas sp. ASV322]
MWGDLNLRLDNIGFSYSATPVFDGFSLEIPSGRTVLLGPNGAGKSTLLGIAASVLMPRSGSTFVEPERGRRTDSRQRRRYRRQVAWLPQDFCPFPGLTVAEHVAYCGWLKGMSAGDARASTGAALEAVDLSSLGDRPVKQLSGGQRRRMGLAGALVHDADVILLDEPTAGLDPLQRERFAALLRRIEPQKVVVVSTHQTEDVHDSYGYVAILDRGVLRFHGTVKDFVSVASDGIDLRDRVRQAYSRYVVGEE